MISLSRFFWTGILILAPLGSALGQDRDVMLDNSQALHVAKQAAQPGCAKGCNIHVGHDVWKVSRIDLNDDGQPEYYLEGEQGDMCGASHCSTAIIAKIAGVWTDVADADDSLTVLQSKTRGMHDLQYGDTRFKWVGNHYQ